MHDIEPARSSRMHEMTLAECTDLLSARNAGRVAFSTGDGLAVLPISYVYWTGKVAFRTSADGMLSSLASRSPVAFEIDELDTADGTAWSVLVRGFSREVRSAVPMVELLRNPQLVPWGEGPRRLVIAIEPESISGRRLTAPEG
jgi:nitroimidazol reductase NimA-like FMN-containing flavoprotein (pyridoxamine 5'-phosphate oxidase superfamily)